jgi:hypothetical protein
LEWFTKSFIPQATAHNGSGKPILLIFDGHKSHILNEMIQLALNNDIELLCLPAHMTHKLQPLDVALFGSLDSNWRKRCELFVREHGYGMQKRQVIQEYMPAWEAAFHPDVVVAAWKACGLRPVNLEIFTEADYAPSSAIAVNACLPQSYPQSSDWINPQSDDNPTYNPGPMETTDSDESSDSETVGEYSDAEDDGEDESDLRLDMFDLDVSKLYYE